MASLGEDDILKVICWDFDGTLVYSGSLWSNSLKEALDKADENHNVSFDEIRKHMSTGFTWQSPNEDYHTITGEKWWEYMNKYFYITYLNLGVSPIIAEQACNNIRDIVKRKENYSPYSDTKITLKAAIEKGYTNIVLSNNYPELPEIIERLELGNFFNNYVISAVVGYDKPRKEIFEFARNLYPHSQEFLMIGDNIIADILGGKSAKMKTVLVHKAYNEHADYCFDDLYSIRSIM